MTALVVIAVVSLIGASLTLFSGFGLGTILLPVFALFFPVELAVALTGVVHFLNNVFKVGMLRRDIAWPVVLRFGLPAMVAAWGGAMLLVSLAKMPLIGSYMLLGNTFTVSPIKVVIAVLLAAFAMVELAPEGRLPEFQVRFLPIGGILSGFFGGLSGHQGAFRTMFLLRAGLGKEAFLASGSAIALCVDLTRLSTYLVQFRALDLAANWTTIVVASLAAFLGSYVGGKLVSKVTLAGVQRLVSVLLLLMAVALGMGLI